LRNFEQQVKQEKQMNTSELIDAALDLAVATAEGMSWWTPANAKWDTNDGYTDWILDEDGVLKRFYFDGSRSRAGHWEVIETFKPSTDWNQGGPIIDRFRPHFIQSFSDRVTVQKIDNEGKNFVQHGQTLLIATMRCFVASKLGNI
jgi:hypothetical protein